MEVAGPEKPYPSDSVVVSGAVIKEFTDERSLAGFIRVTSGDDFVGVHGEIRRTKNCVQSVFTIESPGQLRPSGLLTARPDGLLPGQQSSLRNVFPT